MPLPRAKTTLLAALAALVLSAPALLVSTAHAQETGGQETGEQETLPPIKLAPDFATGGIDGSQDQPNLGINEDFVVNGIEGAGKAVRAAEILSKIEGYMNSIETIHAHFQQIASDGSFASGLLVVDRPGRMRFEYDPPHPVLMIATGNTLVYYDRELEEATYIPTSQTPVWFLLRDDISFDKPLSVVELKQRGNSYLLSLVETDEPDQGTVTLQLQADPMKLLRWQIIDGQGMITQITLTDPVFNREVGEYPFDISEFKDRFPSEDRGGGGN